MSIRPIAFDLGCGKGGWTDGLLAAGFRVIGVDVCHHEGYKGELLLQDVRTLSARQLISASLIVASPPCDQFSRHMMPWTRKRNPPLPDLSIVEACWRLRHDSGIPMVLENVREAQRWLGKANWHCGSFYLWGDVPALMPRIKHRAKESLSSTRRAERAVIPFDLAYWIGRCFVESDLTREAA